MASILNKANPRDKDQTSPNKSIFGRKSAEEEHDPLMFDEGDSASGAAPEQGKTRKRKGSLRKTALLGGKLIASVGRERKGSLSLLPFMKSAQHQSEQERDSELPSEVEGDIGGDPKTTDGPQPFDPPSPSESRDFLYENTVAFSSSESSLVEPPAVSAARLSLLTDPKHLAPPTSGVRKTVNELGSPVDVKSPTSQNSYTSTTDDDELLTIARPAKSYPSQSSGSLVNVSLSSPASSYFPVEPPSVPRLRTSKRSSPLSRSIPISAYPSVDAEPHDYTETEYWGWLILFVTWLTFTVGMGSCLDIWSWAWDVGEKPVAPLELSDDMSLPIVGYYPALIILTGVVAWVWITVAWVGMKYFRHAKIEV